MRSLDWAEKYRPQTLSQVVGHNKAVEELKQWAQSWLQRIPEARAVVLYGRAGIGKTSAAHALAHDMGWEAIEMNASDQRTADIIEKIAGAASQMSSLEGRKRLLIMDEADNIHGTSDRGGERAIVEIIKKTNQPIVLIANELYDMSAGLRGACKPIQFNSVMSRSMIPALKKIAEIEGVTLELGVLEKITENANGDLRSAINDLQAMAQGKTKLGLADIVDVQRDTKENIFKVMVKILKGRNIREAHESTYNLDENPADLISWIDENLPLEYTEKEDLEMGYYYLSRASTFLGRVNRRQNYNMWRYASILMTGGVVVARSHRYGGFVKYQPPSVWRKLGATKSMRQIRDSTALKIGTHCHVSKAYTRSQLFPFFRMLMNDGKYAPKVAALLAFELEEIAFLLEVKSITKKVKEIYEEAMTYIESETEHEIEVFGGFKQGNKSKESEEMPGEIEPEKKSKKEAKPQSTLFDF
jgi:replication factor C large subunit